MYKYIIYIFKKEPVSPPTPLNIYSTSYIRSIHWLCPQGSPKKTSIGKGKTQKPTFAE